MHRWQLKRCGSFVTASYGLVPMSATALPTNALPYRPGRDQGAPI